MGFKLRLPAPDRPNDPLLQIRRRLGFLSFVEQVRQCIQLRVAGSRLSIFSEDSLEKSGLLRGRFSVDVPFDQIPDSILHAAATLPGERFLVFEPTTNEPPKKLVEK